MTTIEFSTLHFAMPAPQKGQSTGSAQPAGSGGGGAVPGPVGPPSDGTTAQPAGGAPQQAPGMDSCMSQLPFILLLVGVFYFLLIRPQQKQEKARQQLIASLQKGDPVVTNGGLHGIVDELTDSTITIQVDSNVRLKFDRTAIQRAAGDQKAEKSA